MEGDRHARGMAAIGITASVSSAVAPRLFFRLFGLSDRDATGGARLGWRLFAVRTIAISALAVRGNRTATELFGPVQVVDQAAWWWGYRRGEIPLRTALMASAASGAIIAMDLDRRRSAAAEPQR